MRKIDLKKETDSKPSLLQLAMIPTFGLSTVRKLKKSRTRSL